MQKRHWNDFETAEAERSGDCRERQTRNTAALRRARVEHIGKGATKIDHGSCVGVRRDAALLNHIESAHFVEAENVIGVTVGVEDRVDASHISCEGLGTQASRRSIRIDGRLRASRGSVEQQVRQSQPIMGTPCEVPVPSMVTLKSTIQAY